MPSRPLSLIVRQLRAAAECDGAGTDGELLSRFLSRRDEGALAALVERHAPMVWGVCSRLLRNPHDAEDAFQATFLVFVQKAATVAPREMVANWLYGVAQQTAVRLRTTAAKRGWREMQMKEMPEPAVVEARDEELLSRLDHELSRLPERFRALIVLCDLEGRTRKEAARQLGCPEGTVASGLARARELLAKRLTRRGLAVSGGSLAAALSHSMASAEVPASAAISTINVATLLAAGKAAGVISGPVATLTQGVLKTMFLNKILTTTMVVLALGAAIITGGSLAVGQTEGKPTVGKDEKAPVMQKPVDPAAKLETEAFTAWGNEVGGLQAGLGFRPGEKRTRHTGETVTVVLRVRNIGKEEAKLSYYREEFCENPPVVIDDGGKPVALEGFGLSGLAKRIDVTLAPGKTVDLSEASLVLRPAREKGKENPVWKLFGTGKFQLQCGKAGGNIQDKTGPDPILRKLATGKLELEVKEPEAIPKPAKKESKIAWGKEENGLQLGLALVPADKTAYRTGETMEFVVQVMNVSKREITITYGRPESTPTITDAKGKQVHIAMPPLLGIYVVPTEKTLRPGDTVELYKQHVSVRETQKEEADQKGQVGTPTIRVGAGRYRIAYPEIVQHNLVPSTPVLSTLVLRTGEVEFEVKEGGGKELPEQKEAFTAWGQEAGGLQAGLGFLAGEKRVYHHGETVTLVVRLRNVGKKAVRFEYIRQYLDERPPVVTDAEGKNLPQTGTTMLGIHGPTEVTLEPGKDIVLETRMHGASGSPYRLLPASGGDKSASKEWPLFVGTGKVSLQYDQVLGNSSSGFIKLDAALSKLATGKLELEVKEAPADKQMPLSPEEATRMKEGSKVTVEFKVESVTKAVLIKSETKKDGWATGHGPDDRCLRPEYPKDKVKARFLSILTPKLIAQLNKAGIRDIEKHFSGKTVRVTGPISRRDYDGFGTPPEVEIVVDDLSQIEVVN